MHILKAFAYNISEVIIKDFDMKYKINLISFIKKCLPWGAEIIMLEEPHKKPAICIADLDGDGIPEIIVGYKWQGEIYATILKRYKNLWYVVANIKGRGYGINYLGVARITEKNINSLIVGWQVGAIWAQLDIIQYTPQGYKHLLKEEVYYSKIEVEDMKGCSGYDGICEIALWIHDTGNAYKVEVYRFCNGELIPAKDVYPYYFPRVVAFYKERVKEIPDAAFYWYYLADAQFKSCMYKDALISINKAINLNLEYPPRDVLIKLKKDILNKLKCREAAINLYPASIKTAKGVLWGYINNRGELIIKPQYGQAFDFQNNGLAIVELNNLYGIINQSGKYVVEPKYESISEFSEGRATVIDSRGFKVIDEKGREVTSKAYDYIGTYKDGRAVFGNSGDNGAYFYGYLDRQGREIIPARYQSAGDFKDEKAIVKVKENEFRLIDRNGQTLNTYKYNLVGNLSEGLLAFQEKPDSKFGYIDESGNIVIKPNFTQARAFDEGRAIVNTSKDYGNKYGLIDTKGKFVIEAKYNDINKLGEGRLAVGKAILEDKPYIGSKYAIADNNGKFLTDFIYYGVSDYKNGLASAYSDKDTFFIDKKGVRVKSLPAVSGSGILEFKKDIIKADVDFRISYLDKTGKVIWQQNKEIPLNNKYKIIEKKYRLNKDYLVYYPEISGIKDKEKEKEVNKKLEELSQVKYIEADVQLDYNYFGDFSVEFFKKNLLVLELNGYLYYFGAAHGMPTKVYPHIDLTSGRFYELKDLFKKDSDYVKVLSDIIDYQIKHDEQYSYVFPDAFKEIKENQPFYIGEDELYIYFEPYEIAPYAAGFPTFRIPYKDIMAIIDTRGQFWRAFN
ncbi:DUF3298 domain-containing protein [Clostridium tetani]|nr:DUF3298 domain-containing protein [Clostridium tetani]